MQLCYGELLPVLNIKYSFFKEFCLESGYLFLVWLSYSVLACNGKIASTI